MSKIFSVFLLALLIFHLMTLRTYPLASVDESWQSSNAYSIFNKNFVSINYPFFLQNTGVPYVMNYLLGLVYHFFGLGLAQGRLFILASSFMLLICLYFFSREFFGKTIAFISIIYLASTRSFLFSAHIIRNDVFLSLLVLISLFFLFKSFIKKNVRFCFISGLIIGFSTEIHQNGLIFIASVFITWIVNYRHELKSKFNEIAAYFLGITVYATYYFFAHVLPNFNVYVSERSYSLLNDHPLPMFSLSPKEMLFSEVSRYVAYFSPNRTLEFIILILALIYSLKSKDKYLTFLSRFMVFSAIGFGLFSSNKTDIYFIYFFCFLSIMFAVFLQFVRSQGVRICIKSLRSTHEGFYFSISGSYLVILIVLINYFFQFKIAEEYSQYNSNKIKFFVSDKVEKNSLILGPTYFWLPLHEYRYRSIYVLSWFRILDKLNVSDSLKKIRPDYILADHSLENTLVNDENMVTNKNFQAGLYNLSRKDFYDFLNKNSTLVGEINLDYHGLIKLYKINYESH